MEKVTEQTLYLHSQHLGELLRHKKWVIVCAESCTGGLFAKCITDIAGSSAYFNYGFVTYSNQAKQNLLNVSEVSLRQYGAVSEAVAKEMAAGALIAAQADIAVSVSGIAGPEGGNEEKPVGTVCFGFATAERTMVFKRYFSGNRNRIRYQAVDFMFRTLIKEFF